MSDKDIEYIKFLEVHNFDNTPFRYATYKVIHDKFEDQIKLLKEELKREREGNDFYGDNDTFTLSAISYGKTLTSSFREKARYIISQRKIKSEDL